MLIILTGLTCSGKTSVARELSFLIPNSHILRQYTTRHGREGEHGEDYIYIDKDEFDTLDYHMGFDISSKYETENGLYCYGTSFPAGVSINPDVCYIIALGPEELTQIYESLPLIFKNSMKVYIDCPAKILSDRALKKRPDMTNEEFARRIGADYQLFQNLFDLISDEDLVVNDMQRVGDKYDFDVYPSDIAMGLMPGISKLQDRLSGKFDHE